MERWQAAEGNEQREANKFWFELAELLGIQHPTRVLDTERKVGRRRIDVFYEDMGILIENKSRGVSLDKQLERGKNEGGDKRFVTPFEQAKWYADNLPHSIRPRYILTCNFDEIRIYDLEQSPDGASFESIMLAELATQLHRLDFFTRPENSRLEREKELSIAAGGVVGTIYDELSRLYKNVDSDEAEQRSLNVLIVRIVFLLYAEDAGLLDSHQAFYAYMKQFPASQMRTALIELFKALRTREDERDPYMSEAVARFPYINGGLFEEDIIIPQFSEELCECLLNEASAGFDWKDISPTIFGAIFESTLNPDTRRKGGMHYTSIENIHKVIQPLFLDELKAELVNIENISVMKNRTRALRLFQDKLASLTILDPACGSGNFLTETYIQLRTLENRVLESLNATLKGGRQPALNVSGGSEESTFDIKVTLDQFYGIEINNYAVEVAKTALWIAEQQMLEKTQEILYGQVFDFLPLKSNTNIRHANALRIDWNEVLPAEKCTYIIGNPPFYGYTLQTLSQKKDVEDVFAGSGVSKKVDYVSCWYKKALDYIPHKSEVNAPYCAFVSTNSICQGEQVPDLWNHFIKQGISIDFAWQTFVWNNEATNQAHVHVIVIGFHKGKNSNQPVLYRADGTVLHVKEINPYLFDAPTVVIVSRSKPISDIPPITKGSQPTDGGNLIIETREEYEEIITHEPELKTYIKPFIGAKEFINDTNRWCFWLVNAPQSLMDNSPELRKRIAKVKEMRCKSSKEQTREAAKQAHVFTEIRQPSSTYIVIPSVSSERRHYVPIGFFTPNIILSNLAMLVPNATLYHFGVLTSQFHNAWMRVVAGRLESRYRYSNKIVYNNFVWPEPTIEQRARIEECAQGVLDARDNHPGVSLAELYDPDTMPVDLQAAHKALDMAVEAAYGVDFGGNEEKIVAHLFMLYAEAILDRRGRYTPSR